MAGKEKEGNLNSLTNCLRVRLREARTRCCGREAEKCSPAYDLLSTKLVLPDDKDELALTLNARKRNLKKSDFNNLLNTYKIDEKVIENIYEKYRKIVPQWLNFIDTSFLPQQMKEEYKSIINKRKSILEIQEDMY